MKKRVLILGRSSPLAFVAGLLFTLMPALCLPAVLCPNNPAISQGCCCPEGSKTADVSASCCLKQAQPPAAALLPMGPQATFTDAPLATCHGLGHQILRAVSPLGWSCLPPGLQASMPLYLSKSALLI